MKKLKLDKSIWRKAAVAALALFVVLAGSINLGRAPALWWDEGWTLTVARNWVERGHYGRLLEGEPAPPGLEAAFPVVWPVVFSFESLGIGVFQGRLPGVLFTFGAFVLLYNLSRRLLNRAAGWAAVCAVLFLLPLGSVNPIVNGRQVLADMPLMFFLLAGYVCFLAVWQKPLIFFPLAAIFWGIALLAKAQALPFWLVSMLIPLLLALYHKRWKSVALLVGSIVGAWSVSRILLSVQALILEGYTVPATSVQGLYQAVALVPLWNVRVRALIVLGVSGLPALFGLTYFAWQYLKGRESLNMADGKRVVRLALFVLTGSWLGWFVLLSNSGPRYLAAPGFLGGIFVGAMLDDFTGHFKFRETILRASEVLKLRSFGRSDLSAAFAIAVTVPMALVTLITCYPSIFNADQSVEQLARYLNTQTPPDALIETYDSELFFFLDRPYHYPPDQVHVELIRRYYFEQDFQIDYDPLAANPDYLVVGPTSAAWRLYDPVLETGQFRLLVADGRYSLYERVRN